MVQAAERMCKGPEAAVCWVIWRSSKKFIMPGGEARGWRWQEMGQEAAGIGDQLAPAPGLVRTSSLVVSPRQGLAVLTRAVMDLIHILRSWWLWVDTAVGWGATEESCRNSDEQ